MSFFAKIFGSSDKKSEEKTEQKPVQKKADSSVQDKIERERAKNNIEKQIKQSDDKQKKLQAKAEQLKEKAKDLVKNDKKAEAKKYLGEVQRINKQIEVILIHKKTLLENLTQLQSADMTADTMKVLQQTKKHLEAHQKNSQKLLDLIEQANIRKRQQQEIHERMKALVDNDSDLEAEDEMLDEIMKEVENERKRQQKKIQAKEVKIKVPEQKTKPVQQRDQIQDMLNAL